jgi:hypothetical protein
VSPGPSGAARPASATTRFGDLLRERSDRIFQATLRWTIKDYERILWPVVRALENPDISQRLVKRLRPALKELLGSWRIDYLSVCVSEDLENALDRYPFQPRHFKEPVSILERLCAPDPAVAKEAVTKVEKTLALLR